jgi:hypothetical protein
MGLNMVGSYNPILPSMNNDGTYCVLSGRKCVASGHENISESYYYFIDTTPPTKDGLGVVIFMTVIFIGLLALAYKYRRA